MGRGFARKPDRTRKCRCGNSKYDVFEIRINSEGKAVITLWCHECGAMWDTQSREARRHCRLDGHIYPGRPRTYRDVLADADAQRKALLRDRIDAWDEEIAELEKKKAKALRELDTLAQLPLVP